MVTLIFSGATGWTGVSGAVSPMAPSKKSFLHQLRRVNSRNALTHRLLETIAKEQKDYLSTGDILRLKPLPQVELAKKMNQSMNNSGAYALPVCHSWLSRLIPSLSIRLPDGSEQPLKVLLPNRRDRIKQTLRALLNEESRNIIEGVLQSPYDDCQLQELLHTRFAISTGRRNISAVRRELGIPSTHVRSQDFWHLLAVPFSNAYPLTSKEIALHVPQTAGVYELCLKEGQVTYPKGGSAIFYIGRSKNLEKRLMEHLQALTKNKILTQYLGRETCGFRFLVAGNSYVHEEKRLYDLFVSTFGVPPAANRVSPGGTGDER
jgi:transposase